VLYDFGLDRVTSHHYFAGLGIVPLAIVMNRKKFESLPKAGQDAILKYDMDYINKLYIASMLEYDASLVKKLQSDPKRKVVFPSAADQKAARAAWEPVIKAWAGKTPRNGEVYKALVTELEKDRSKK
jgi:TRAP-type C4-dicarboxylate transport system substrate-binding protein